MNRRTFHSMHHRRHVTADTRRIAHVAPKVIDANANVVKHLLPERSKWIRHVSEEIGQTITVKIRRQDNDVLVLD